MTRWFPSTSRFHRAALLALCTAIAACGGGETRPPELMALDQPDHDIHSYARPAEARVTHVALDLTADFQARTLRGTARLSLTRTPGTESIVLDTDELVIDRVLAPDGGSLDFTLGDDDPLLGRALTVNLRPGVSEIVVHYETSPQAGALQWLTPEQTAGRKHPYLFSQGQSILTRSWIPTQDSPGIRQTYSARIVVPNELRAVMSAEQLTPGGAPAAEGRVFEFRLAQPIPPYLIALAIGDIQFRSLGPRTGVYTEPSVLPRAASEFAEIEKMVSTAERLLGEYVWGRYDILVLPPSFPYGGMENPRLTFATPTILAGDRSLVSLIAHELAHSWSGNLVTNATWGDFWLNEGMTTYVESRIMEAMYGTERSTMLDVLARRELDDEIARLGGPSSPDTVLHIDLAGRSPEDGSTGIPYQKGAALLKVIESATGRDRFDAWLRGYFARHAFQPITSAEFLADLRANLIHGDAALEQQLQLDTWVYAPGLPSNAPTPVSAALTRIEDAAARFATGQEASEIGSSTWTTPEWLHFLRSLPRTLSRAQLSDLDSTFGLSRQGNSEILFEWLRLAILNRYEPAFPAVDGFLTSQGRRKFLRPLYEELMRTDWGKVVARRIYAKARDSYHPVAVGTLDRIVR